MSGRQIFLGLAVFVFGFFSGLAVINPVPPSQPQHVLTTSAHPSGSGSIAPSGGAFDHGKQITLTAKPASDYVFDHWGGDVSGSTTPVIVTMNSDKKVIAYFKALPPPPQPPPPAPSPTPRPSFYDDFSDIQSGWPTTSPTLQDKFEYGYQITDDESEYYILVKKKGYGFLPRNRALGEYSDFIVEVDGRIETEQADGVYGLTFRRSSDASNQYDFQVSTTGRYRIGKSVDREYSVLVDWTESPHIKKGANQINHLEVQCLGPKMKFFVNGQFLTSVTDSAHQEGFVGLYAGSSEQTHVRFCFDNFYISWEK